jgi:hypothetical protein
VIASLSTSGLIANLFCCCGVLAVLFYFAPRFKLFLINRCGIIAAHSRSHALAASLPSYDIIFVHLRSLVLAASLPSYDIIANHL